MRRFQPEDLFRVRRVRSVAWSADAHYAALEITKPARILGSQISNEIALLDTKSGVLRTLTINGSGYVGFFNPEWSPSGQRLAFLSAGTDASIRAWIWTAGAGEPSPLTGFDVRAGFFADRAIAWIDDNHIALLAWDVGAAKYGSAYTEILRGPNAARGWQQAAKGQLPAVSVLESGRLAHSRPPSARLVVVDVRTKASRTLVRGPLHDLKLSADGHFIKFNREDPGVPGQPISSFFALASPDVDAAYVAVNQGTAIGAIDLRSGEEVSPSAVPERKIAPSPKDVADADPPRPDAVLLSKAPAGDAELFRANSSDGSHVWLCHAATHARSSCTEIWRANEWTREIATGAVQSISYKAADGSALTAWLLLPTGSSTAAKLPLVTIIYPGLLYDEQPPFDFSLYDASFWEHPQLFAALGYAVLLPSMPEAKNQADKLRTLPDGVIPAIDEVISRGIVDPKRIAIVGQSDGGFATLGLITQTNRFRSAIESAGFSDLVSLYGTFYGQYRYGDAGPPERAQVLRMLRMESGVDALQRPPWEDPDLYRSASAIYAAGKVQTPLMLIHGDIDFVPIQQGEEFFTALLRQDKRAVFVRYQGEGHTISDRANVLDLWKRVAAWLAETMPPG